MVVEIIFLIDIFDLMWYQHFNEEGARSRKTSALVVLDSGCGGNSGPAQGESQPSGKRCPGRGDDPLIAFISIMQSSGTHTTRRAPDFGRPNGRVGRRAERRIWTLAERS
jgi:hypothetical protein